ncbi:MAG TPA: DUF389 domain-containing protein [Candidatus Kapabacteria bacterium]
MNLFAAVVASYGLLSNSPAVVIGAMVIAVLLGPIAGIGLSLINNDRKLILWSLFSLITGTIEVFIISFIIGKLHSEYPITGEILSRTQPNLFDLIIAFFGGCAGAYASERMVPGGTLIGVAIATALVPPIASSALLLSHHEPGLFRGAFLLFLTNLVAIQCAYSLMLYVLQWRRRSEQRQRGRGFIIRLAPSLLFLGALAFVLGTVLNRRVIDLDRESTVRKTLDSGLVTIAGALLGETTVHFSDSSCAVIAAVRVPTAISPGQVDTLQERLVRRLSTPVQLTIRSLVMRVANSGGYLYEPKELKEVIDQPETPTIVEPAIDTFRIIDSLQAIGVRDSLVDSIHHADSLSFDSLHADHQRKAKQKKRFLRPN